MPLVMTLEGPRVKQPGMGGFFSDAWDLVTSGIEDAWSTVTGDDLRAYQKQSVAAVQLKRTGMRGLGLNSWLDPIKAHPLMLIVGIGVGIWAANRYGKARR